MTPAEIVRAAREKGVHLRVEGDRLFARPRSLLPPDLEAALREQRGAVIAYIETEPPTEGRLLDGGRVWIPAPERPGYCPCDEALAWDPRTGLCRTCYGAVYGAKIPVGRRPNR